MLREPPLVEIPIATSCGFACARSCRKKITSTPTSLASAVMLAGSMEREIAGTVSYRQEEAHNPSPNRWHRLQTRRYRRESTCLHETVALASLRPPRQSVRILLWRGESATRCHRAPSFLSKQ